MKKLLERMKSYSFWISLSGALIIFLNCLGNIFGFKIENAVVENVIMSFAGILVVFGLVTKDTKGEQNENISENDTSEDNKDDGSDTGSSDLTNESDGEVNKENDEINEEK